MAKDCILFLLLVGTVLTGCPATLFTPTAASQSVTFALTPFTAPSTLFSLAFPLRFPSVPALALAVSELAIEGDGSSGSSWVVIESRDVSGVTVRLVRQSSSWNIRKVQLWGSTHPQLQLGSVTVTNTPTPAGNSKPLPPSTMLRFPATLPLSPSAQLVTRCFLNGLSSTSVLRTVQVGSSELQGATVAVIVTGEINFDRIWLSYALVSLGSRQFAAYGGFQQITPAQTVYSVLKGFADPQLAFFGLNGFNLTASSAAVGITVDGDFYLGATTSGDFNVFTSSYLFLGLPGATPCSGCSLRGEGSRYMGGFCLPECPDSTEQVQLSGGGSLCRRCMAELGQVGAGGKCVCMGGFVNSGGKCVKQPSSNILPSFGFDNQPNLQPSSPALDTSGIYNVATPVQSTQTTLPAQPILPSQSTQTVQPILPAQPLQSTQTTLPPPSIQSMQPAQPTQQTVPLSGAISTLTSNPSSPSFPPPLVNNPSVSASLPSSIPNNMNPSSGVSANIAAGFSMISQAISSSGGNCILPFTYWNGNECICLVGYQKVNNQCIKIGQSVIQFAPLSANQIKQRLLNSTNPYPPNPNSSNSIISIPISPSPSPNPISPNPNPNPSLPTIPNISVTPVCTANSYFNGQSCVCLPGFFSASGLCTSCPTNSTWNGKFCQCDSNFYLHNNTCVQIVKQTCPFNSYDNGLGSCVCLANFTMINNSCRAVNSCPLYSQLVGGQCVCNQGYIKIENYCSKCQAGAFWSSTTQKCIFVCGENSRYNAVTAKCECLPGYGIGKGGVCEVCKGQFHLLNGYCVVCPIMSQTDPRGSCQCLTGFITTADGNCAPKCKSTEIYDIASTSCICKEGFFRVGNGQCSPCPAGTLYVNGQCNPCPPYSQLQDGVCRCISGFIPSPSGLCVSCGTVNNSFLQNGFCVICPHTQIYNKVLGRCECPFGRTLTNNLCVSTCGVDELLDSEGNCYTCQMNEIIVNGKCACRPGYTKKDCICQIDCEDGFFPFAGQCGKCPAGMEYYQTIQGCICGLGFYLSVNNICERAPVLPSACNSTSYYNAASNTCVPCSVNCLSCNSSSYCLTCVNGFTSIQGVCTPQCGDGFIRGSERCDVGLNFQAGCQLCQIAPGYTCNGEPSICQLVSSKPIVTPPVTPPNNPSGATLELVGTPSLNSNNIFIVLRTTPTFTFPNPTAMQSFIQGNFSNTIKPSIYCAQQNAPKLDRFDCLLIYPSGVPNSRFRIFFSYNYGGLSANTTVTVDPLASASRNRRVE